MPKTPNPKLAEAPGERSGEGRDRSVADKELAGSASVAPNILHSDALLAAVFAAQQVIVLRRLQPGVLALVPPSPAWLARFAPREATLLTPFPLAEYFPFLEAFLPDAEILWESGNPGPLNSDLWTEPAPEGADFQLEATALRLEQGAFLLIRRAESEFAARQQVLQLARERMLDHELLLEEISAKEILLHCIVHDLAGPLAGIQGCLDMLASGSLGPSESEFVQMGLLQASRQQRLIRTILDVFAHRGPGQTGGVDASLSHDLPTCIRLVSDSLRPAFLTKKIMLQTRCLEALQNRGHVVAEASRLERVLSNLLENALRFAPTRSTVTIEVCEEGDYLSVIVADEGPGVAPEVLPHLFHRFITGSRSPGKSGLGLFFCRITLERWGGSIACLPVNGRGARFKIQLKRVLDSLGNFT